jgi:hypothetical protein
VLAADTLLLTIPNQLGVDYNTRLLETFLHRPFAGSEHRSPAEARCVTNDPVNLVGISLISDTNLLLALA